MAEGVLFDIAKEIIGKAGDLALKEVALIWGVKDEINKLKETVSKISAVILDAEAKQHGSEVIKEWLKRLKDAMCDADDLLDEISTEALRREVMTRGKKAKEVRIFFSKSNQLAYGVRMGHKVKEMRERLVAIDAEPVDRQFHLDERREEIQVRNESRRQTHSFVSAEDVIGREEDKKAIIGSLLDPNVKENVSVLAIVGIGGLGKTTLAQLVFNDEKVKNHFELKLWVCVSENFDVKIIVQKILECVKNEKPKDLEKNMLVNNLQKEINGKRYMLVLDDVWNEDHEKWSELKQILMGGAQGSRILVTTRSVKVAKISRTSQPHVLQGLEEQHAWSLFKKMAFEEGEEPKEASFVNIGKDILKMCVGVPLAIRTIGGLLYFKKSEREWLSFKDNELSKIAQNENDILPTLKLSYDYLPSHLKQCFAYCSLFPKDYEIEKESLIYMWMAQGFIKLYNEKQCPEDVGHEYYMDLLWRSFFQEVEEGKLGNISKFKIHDLMHDIAIQVTGPESTTIYSKKNVIDEKTRHVSFGDMLYSPSKIPISLYRARRIKTFLLPCQTTYWDHSTFSEINQIIASFKFIRLLDLHSMGIKTIPSSIKELKHLRYLDLSKNEDIEMLPNFIVKLYNLQTLKLSWCSKLKELPRDINKLVNLRFLEIHGCSGLTHMPNGLGQLTNLQTLSRFVTSEGRIDSVPKGSGGLKELAKLNELRENLSIENLKHGKDAALEYKDANLKEKHRLDRLDLNWVEEDSNETGAGYDDMSLEALQPHINLKALSLNRYGGVIFPHWFVSLTNLVDLRIENCKRCRYLPPLSHLPSLKSLRLDTMNDLEYIFDNDMSEEVPTPSTTLSTPFFPSLKSLTIGECPNLKGWWRRIGRDLVATTSASSPDHQQDQSHNSLPLFPLLSYLWIINCPKMTSMRLFPNLEKSLYLEKTFLVPSSSLSLSSSSPPSELNYMILDSIEDIESLSAEWALHSLKELQIWNCPKLTSMSGAVRNLTSLRSLSIGHCEEFDPLRDMHDDGMEWRCLICLRDLCFRGIPKLKSLPMGLQCISTLKYLTISNCPNLMTLPVLNSLHDLCFRGIPKLKFLPVGPQCVSTLKRLTISYCPDLMTLPELTSLKYLDIGRCQPNLTSLETLSCLISLRLLRIEDFTNSITFPDSIRISNLT